MDHVGLILAAINVAMVIIGFIGGRQVEKHWWQNELIRRGFAKYHWMNAKWYFEQDEAKVNELIAKDKPV